MTPTSSDQTEELVTPDITAHDVIRSGSRIAIKIYWYYLQAYDTCRRLWLVNPSPGDIIPIEASLFQSAVIYRESMRVFWEESVLVHKDLAALWGNHLHPSRNVNERLSLPSKDEFASLAHSRLCLFCCMGHSGDLASHRMKGDRLSHAAQQAESNVPSKAVRISSCVCRIMKNNRSRIHRPRMFS